MPPELIKTLGLNLPFRRRDPHYFLPTPTNRHLLFGSDEAAMKRQFISFFSEADWKANGRLRVRLCHCQGQCITCMDAPTFSPLYCVEQIATHVSPPIMLPLPCHHTAHCIFHP